MVSTMFAMVVAVRVASKIAGGRIQSAASSTLTGINIAGSVIAGMVLCAPLYTMVIPVWKEGSVGDRKVYGHVLAFFNSVMWTLYASTDLPNKLLLFIISGMGIIVHFSYTTFYITFAEPKKRRHAVIILSAFLVVALIAAVLVASTVLITHTWSSTFVDVMASISGASTQIVPAYDLVMVIMKTKQINDMNPLIMSVISLLSACTWAPYGFMSVPVNPYVVVPNVIGIVSTVSQITVYSWLLYRKTRIHSAQKEVELSTYV